MSVGVGMFLAPNRRGDQSPTDTPESLASPHGYFRWMLPHTLILLFESLNLQLLPPWASIRYIVVDDGLARIRGACQCGRGYTANLMGRYINARLLGAPLFWLPLPPSLPPSLFRPSWLGVCVCSHQPPW